MSLDQGIAHGKEKRKPYKGSKAVDRTCRNHGTCPYCQKKIKYKKQKQMGAPFNAHDNDNNNDKY